MSFRMSRVLLSALVLVTLTACGGAGAADSDAEGRSSAAAGMPKECPSLPFTFQVRRAGGGPNETFTAVGARADMQLESRSYKVYLTDYPLDPEESLLSQVMNKPVGGTAVQVGIQTDYGSTDTPSIEDWKKLEVGDLALDIHDSRQKHGTPTGQPIMTFSIATDQGPTTNASVELQATAKVLYVGEDGICLDVQGVSESGLQISGVVAAAV